MKDNSLRFASIVAAGAASLCCIGPLVAAGLGVGAFGAAAVFEELRPYLLGLTALLLAGAFHLAYRKSPEAQCADGVCAVSPEKKRKQKMLFWVFAAAVAVLAAFPNYSAVPWGDAIGADVPAFAAGKSDETAVSVFSVEGMTCPACAAGIKATLERRRGVKLAEVDSEQATARIRFDHSQISAETLIAAIGELGFTAKLKEPQS